MASPALLALLVASALSAASGCVPAAAPPPNAAASQVEPEPPSTTPALFANATSPDTGDTRGNLIYPYNLPEYTDRSGELEQAKASVDRDASARDPKP